MIGHSRPGSRRRPSSTTCAADIGVPTAVMTYGNIAYHMGFERFELLAAAGVSGASCPTSPRGSGGMGISGR